MQSVTISKDDAALFQLDVIVVLLLKSCTNRGGHDVLAGDEMTTSDAAVLVVTPTEDLLQVGRRWACSINDIDREYVNVYFRPLP